MLMQTIICRMAALSYEVRESEDPAFLDGRRGDVYAAGKKVGVFGEISPDVLTAFGLEHPVAAFEMDFGILCIFLCFLLCI